MLKGYFAYVRVSTQRQGQLGTSLTEQTAAIDRYAKTWNLEIVKRFEERETAAKTGRPVFLDMVKALKRRQARGVLIHKIDRSARNLRDWAELGSLLDLGIEVHFVNESLDLNSRGGRLSADIQAVVASDYIRNLREETIKGIRGRIKQGLFPFPAPPGYLNLGSARPKEIDPVTGPLIKSAFELYATGRYSLYALTEKMFELGLRNRNRGKLSKNGINICLRNPFYMGLLKVSTMKEVFVGQHKPLITKALFDEVQNVLDGKRIKKTTNHFFVYRRRVRCGYCQNLLIAERQKGHAYYRCHTRNCAQKPLREELIEGQLCEVLKRIEFGEDELQYFEVEILKLQETEPKRLEKMRRELSMRAELIAPRLNRLADAYMDGVFDGETYALKKNSLTRERIEIGEKLAALEDDNDLVMSELKKFLELAKSAYLSFKSANDEEKRELVKTVTSNITAKDKTLSIKLNSPFDKVFERHSGPGGCPFRDTSRTLSASLSQLLKFFRENQGGRQREKAPG
ncbi:MAG: recombinase family protein [Chloracidobacterium sp.]|nr:recombinase family protein [Chloracidobacterium sp.]